MRVCLQPNPPLTCTSHLINDFVKQASKLFIEQIGKTQKQRKNYLRKSRCDVTTDSEQKR
jgi:hypothetical protein